MHSSNILGKSGTGGGTGGGGENMWIMISTLPIFSKIFLWCSDFIKKNNNISYRHWYIPTDGFTKPPVTSQYLSISEQKMQILKKQLSKFNFDLITAQNGLHFV